MSSLKAVESMSDEEKGDAELFERIKAEHPGEDLILCRSLGQVAVFRSPPYAEWKRFKAMYLDAAKRGDANETLAYGCLVFPTSQELRVIFNKKPALADLWASSLASAAGMGAEVVEKK